ncbi:MAG: acylphosphatase [Anaerolineae bacterium]|nr:acylphosphatase [Anaerolineae bacterium]
MSSNLKGLHAIVHGTVQGVSFRYYARLEAARLGLTGWVRNLPDRTVETYAVGPRDRLESYHDWLQRGPSQADVSWVDATWSDTPEQTFETFEISYGTRDY